MSNTQPNNSMIHKLLDLSGYDYMLKQGNFQYFSKMLVALEQDSQSEQVDHYNNVDVPFFGAGLNDTHDLFQHEHMFLHGLIESWSCSVTSPILDTLNHLLRDCSDVHDITVYFDGDLASCQLRIEGGDEFAQNLLKDDVCCYEIEEAITELEAWSNCIALIAGADEVVKSLHAAAIWHNAQEESTQEEANNQQHN